MANIDKSAIKGIIFDYGGTIDSAGEHWSEVIWRGYQKAGVAVGKGAFREAYVYAERELARTLHILPQHNFHDMLKIKMQIELEHLVREGLFAPQLVQEKGDEIALFCYQEAKRCIEEARPTLDALGKRFPMVLVSNFYGNIKTVLEDFNLAGYFGAVIESSVVGVRKPDPSIFKMGVDALGLKPEQVLVIGDSYKKDILPAESLGCKAVWLKGKGWTHEEDTIHHPNEIKRLDEVLQFLD